MAIDYNKYLNSTGTHYISNSGKDENGAYKGGKAGDQTGHEWELKRWYSRPWTVVLRYPDQSVALTIARLGIAAALNDKVGYDQTQRGTYWTKLKAAGFDASKITTPCEDDCTAGVSANVRAAGHLHGIKALQDIPLCTSRNMRTQFTKAGFKALTESKYLTGTAYLLPGDILLCESHHAATNITCGSAVRGQWHPGAGASQAPTEAPTTVPTLGRKATPKADPDRVWTYLMTAIGNAYGVAGLMGNLRAESALKPTNLQGTYEKKLGYTNDTYTAAVDNGTYTGFSTDAAGYGLAQWTSSGRKKSLLAYARQIGSSIGNLDTQLEYLMKELSGSYKAVLSVLKTAKSVREASDAVLLRFEIPKNRGESVQVKRAGYGEEYYNTYAKGEATMASTLKKGDKGEAVKTLQRYLIEAGYPLPKYGADGDYGTETETAVKAFQAAAGVPVTGTYDAATRAALEAKAGARVVTVTGDTVNLRSKPDTSGIILGAAHKGDQLPYVATAETGWYQVMHNGVACYISNRYATISAANSPPAEAPTGAQTAQEMDWWKSNIQKIFGKNIKAKITDVRTGLSWYEIRKAGRNHADVQPATAADTAKLKRAYGGGWSWARRPIWVTINGVNYAASMNGMPHGGSSISGNKFPGHHCIHFTNSRTHGTNRVDENHQRAVKEAAKARM